MKNILITILFFFLLGNTYTVLSQSKKANFLPDDHETDVDIRYSDGKVTIGADDTQKPGDYRLYVEDGILTEEVIIALKNSSQWADYVFEKGYPLNSLASVEEFILKHQHLPKVPAAQQLVNEGLALGKMDAILLRQLEELWLHLIQLKEKRDEVKEESQLRRQILIDLLERLD